MPARPDRPSRRSGTEYRAARGGVRSAVASITAGAVVAAGIALGAVPAAAAEGSLLVNGGFELGAAPWVFAGGAGIATNNPHSGSALAYLDDGDANSISQDLSVPTGGEYRAEAWVATGGAGGVFGLRDANGVIASLELPSAAGYRLYSLPGVDLPAGADVQVFFTGGSEWTNIDDVSLSRDLRVLDTFAIAGQQGPTSIDAAAGTISLQVPYDRDVTSLAATVELADGALMQPDPSEPHDYREPVEFTVRDRDGAETRWTVTVVREPKGIVIQSADQALTDAFNWSKWRARQHVQTGKSGPINVNGDTPGPTRVDYIPSYWAGYAHRTAFYSRDFVHQASGAHLLGLEAENKSMLTAFAATANASRKWYPLWALNFDGSPYTIDYKSDENFVREVPAVFELVEEAAEQYRWTGDADYLDDPVLWQYYSKAVTDFVALHDARIPNGVAEGTGRGIFAGAASYDERPGVEAIEAGDGIASQYAAYRSFASMAAAKGEQALADQFTTKADELQRYFNEEWGVTDAQAEYVRARNGEGEPVLGFGREPSAFEAIKKLIDPDAKRSYDFLPYLDRMFAEDRPENIEALTYVPDALFEYGHDAEAYAWMQDIVSHLHEPHVVSQQGVNGDYPETSFTLVSQTVEGLAGVEPNAPEHAVVVESHLPEALPWLELDHVAVGEHRFGVRHEGRTSTVVTHEEGPQQLTTTVRFDGGWKWIVVDGEKTKPELRHVNGRAVSELAVDLPVGASVEFRAQGALSEQQHGDTILTHPTEFELAAPADEAVRVSTTPRLDWQRSENADEYRVVVARDRALTEVVAERTVRGTSVHLKQELQPGLRYFWSVTAVNSETGQRLAASETRSFRTEPTTTPAAPAGVEAYRSGDKVVVLWDPAEDAVSSVVWRASVGSDDFVELASSVGGSSFVDTDASGGPYRYRVAAANELGTGQSTTVDEVSSPDEVVSYLSDREWISATTGWGTIGRDRSVSGGTLRIEGQTFAKGIGAHANSEIVFALAPTDASFSAMVGVDDASSAQSPASIVFQVLADGVVVYDSGVMRATSPAQAIELDVLGVRELTLRASDADGSNNSDHADWGDARIRTLG